MEKIWRNYKKANEFHHAYLIEGEREEVFSGLVEFFEKKLKVSTKGNPDFWLAEFETFNIDEGRALKERHEKKSFSGGEKFFVFSFSFITREAENSLLKLFEEPTFQTHFFVIVPNREFVSPTLRSRFEIVKADSSNKRDADPLLEKAEVFLAAPISERLKMIRGFIGEIANGGESKTKAIEFLNNLIKATRKKVNLKKREKRIIKFLKEIEKCRDYLNDKSSSNKMIMEHISLIAPRL